VGKRAVRERKWRTGGGVAIFCAWQRDANLGNLFVGNCEVRETRGVSDPGTVLWFPSSMIRSKKKQRINKKKMGKTYRPPGQAAE